MQPYNNYPQNDDGQRSYEQGYSPAPQFTAPPTNYYQPQVPYNQQYAPYPPQQQPGAYPYPQQQMMYPPMPQITINNVNQNNPIMVGMAGKVQLNMWVRLVYFLVIGWWLGLSWLIVALVLICTIIGAPVGIVMLALLPVIATLHR